MFNANGFAISLFLIVAIVAVFLLLTVFALVDIVRSKFEGNHTKLIWVIVVIFVHLLGPILYFTIGRKQKINVHLQ